VRAIRAACGADTVDLSGQLTLKQLAALTGHAKLFVGVDSAPMHIAAAMGTPVVALFGPSGELEWGPWRVANRVIVSDAHPCRPCGNDGCGGGKVSECLTTPGRQGSPRPRAAAPRDERTASPLPALARTARPRRSLRDDRGVEVVLAARRAHRCATPPYGDRVCEGRCELASRHSDFPSPRHNCPWSRCDPWDFEALALPNPT
jgi:hypothetical protein